jgi:SAM-dependent methyltransferase
MNPLFFNPQSYLVCVECGERVDYHPLSTTSGYFLCKGCRNIHLRQNGISIFLPKQYENKEVFGKFFLRYALKIKPRHRPLFIKKSRSIKNNKQQSWEDTDIKFWDDRYHQDLYLAQAKIYPSPESPREVMRKKHLFDYIAKDYLRGKIICEIGTGEARTIRSLLHPDKFPYYYIPTDYSYQALLYLKKVFKNNNVYYIQCLGNRLPFKKEIIDYLLILGVLHHMPKKEKHIRQLAHFVKPGGWFLMEEGYLRDSALSDFFFKYTKFIFEPEHSEHEERIEKKLLLQTIEDTGEILHIHHSYSPLMTVLMVLFNNFPFLHKDVYIRTAFLFDQLFIKTVGKIFPAFSSGQCDVVIKRI